MDMIKTGKLNKYFNKNRKNEIHVINDIEVSLPDKGLVVLLGPSGSGKTTLLNVLGGLDKVKGEIMFNDIKIDKYKVSKWDEIRNQHIGYIFQNYLLLEQLSVYENIRLTLNMVGITDKDEIDKRITYLLEAVGLKNYKKRKAGMLSGGQQQRVAIARALAKNPQVIIADEPTGNLDSKNTIEVMNIIKKIAETKLVLLVTHERELATAYATRIIELQDGKIVDDSASSGLGNLYRVRQDTDIYLKDLHRHELNDGLLNVDLYSDQEDIQALNLKLVLNNGTLYVDFGNQKFKKIQLLDQNNEVKLIDAHYEDEQEVQEVHSFDYESIIDETKKKKNQPVISLKHSFRLAFSKIINQTKRKRLLFIGFLISGLILSFISASLYAAFDAAEENYMSRPVNMVLVTVKDGYRATYSQIDGATGLTYMVPRPEQHQIQISVPYFDQFNLNYGKDDQIYLYPHFDLENVGTSIIYGRNIENTNEVLLDVSVLKQINHEYSSSIYKMLGINSMKEITGRTMMFYGKEFTIVGFTERQYGSFTMDQLTYYQTKYWTVFEEQPKYDTVEGYINEEFGNSREFFVHSTDVKQTIAYLKLNTSFEGIEDLTTIERDNFMDERQTLFISLSIFSLIILSVTWVSLFFVMRTSVLDRMGELSVFRALGVRKKDLYKTYLIEVLVITGVTSMIGFFLGIYYITNFNPILIEQGIVRVTFLSTLFTILIVLATNILFGLLPIIMILRKTPSQLMSSYDA